MELCKHGVYVVTSHRLSYAAFSYLIDRSTTFIIVSWKFNMLKDYMHYFEKEADYTAKPQCR